MIFFLSLNSALFEFEFLFKLLIESNIKILFSGKIPIEYQIVSIIKL